MYARHSRRGPTNTIVSGYSRSDVAATGFDGPVYSERVLSASFFYREFTFILHRARREVAVIFVDSFVYSVNVDVLFHNCSADDKRRVGGRTSSTLIGAKTCQEICPSSALNLDPEKTCT